MGTLTRQSTLLSCFWFRPILMKNARSIKESSIFFQRQTCTEPLHFLYNSKIHFHRAVSGSYYGQKYFHTMQSWKNSSSCDLTANRVAVTRGSFSKVTEEDVKFFKSFLEEHRVVTNEEDLRAFNTDWLGLYQGFSSVLLKPKNTEEVSKILSYCNERNLAVCPQGGNTGLVGGSVPVFDEIIISTSLMTEVESVDEHSGVLTCQAGCVLESLDQHLAQYGLMMPLDLGAKGTCQIGGNASTNAGGLRLVRYGNLHGSILGVEAVLASGEVIDCLSSLKKDNTGYDLKHLFIGSEGTLGVVTKLSISCPVRPVAKSVSFLGLNSFENVLHTLMEAKSRLGEILSSAEFMDEPCVESVTAYLGLRSPIRKHNFYMLIETSGCDLAHDEEKVTRFLDHVTTGDASLVSDGVMTTEVTKMNDLWAIRERIAEAVSMEGFPYLYDICLPLPSIYSTVEAMRERVGARVTRCYGYGHLGDGNLHLEMTSPVFDQEVLSLLEPFLFEVTSALKGSVSAEHGIGFSRKALLSYSKSDSAIALMAKIKALLDPKGLLNPYKVLGPQKINP